MLHTAHRWLQVVLIQVGRRIQRFAPRLISWATDRFPFIATDGPIPWTPWEKDLKQARVTLITTAGLYPEHQQPFDMKRLRGDPSYRVIPADTDLSKIRLSDVQYDRSQIDRDLNVVFPLARLRELAEAGVIGEVAPRHYSFMGYVTEIDALRENAHEVADQLRKDKVDAAVLIPACILCNQSIGFIQREIERAGIATVAIYFVERAARGVSPPRGLLVEACCGWTLSGAGDAARQQRILNDALDGLESIDTPGTLLTGAYEPVGAVCIHCL